MRIQSIKIKNYRVFKDVHIDDIPDMAVFLGKNGSGKSTLFDVFSFLYDALQTNVKAAFMKRGSFKEVVSREQSGNIEFEIKFRASANDPLTTYELSIGLGEKDAPIVKKEVMRFRRGQTGAPWKILEFKNGEGYAAQGEINKYEDVTNAGRSHQKLDSPDILAIKGLGQFKEFVAVAVLRRLIEDWFVSDFHIEDARATSEAGYSERLSTTGANLPQVARYIHDYYPDVFKNILATMERRVPGVKSVTAQATEDGRILLRFQDAGFKDPFAARYVSDGTVKMFTYLLLLHDPNHHALLCVEEPENQLYPELLEELAEEFRSYTEKGGQVFISTHSPDFLNAISVDELYCLEKSEGFTQIHKASKNKQIRALAEQGDQLGYLWRQGLLNCTDVNRSGADKG